MTSKWQTITRRHWIAVARVVCIALCVVAVAGCGSSPYVAVFGDVTYLGKAIADGTVVFEPIDSTTAQSKAAVIKGGKYRLSAAAGLLPARYKVRITARDPATKATLKKDDDGLFIADREEMELLPPQYHSETTLVRVVDPSGANEIHFHLD